MLFQKVFPKGISFMVFKGIFMLLQFHTVDTRYQSFLCKVSQGFFPKGISFMVIKGIFMPFLFHTVDTGYQNFLYDTKI